MDLLDNPRGNYRFLAAIPPFSAGVVAMPGYEIVRACLGEWVPWRRGFERIRQFLSQSGRPHASLCAMELRLPAPLSFEGFKEFNRAYREVLVEWDLMVDKRNPVARTNIAPEGSAPNEPSLHAFSYTRPVEAGDAPPTFIVAGAGDLRDQAVLSQDSIVRAGETSPDAMKEKANVVMGVMETRLKGLRRSWPDVTAVDVYTVHPIRSFLPETILKRIGPAAARGVHWYYGRPPIAGLDFEMDLRGVREEIALPV